MCNTSEQGKEDYPNGNELVSLGIAKSRLAAEGYGQQFPVADNATRRQAT
jgi:hypothetical protein